MGSSCSSGQAHKDKDSVSTRSEESIACCRSPSYQVSGKKSSQQQEADGKGKKQQQQQHGNHSTSPPQQPHSGVILEASTVTATVQQQFRGNSGASGVQVESVSTPSAVILERKPTKDGLSKVRNVATSSISADSMSLSSPPGTSIQSPRDFDKCDAPLPQEVQQLPENLQNLLMGCIASARTTTKTRKIVIYVCAADSQDCCIEKGVLHNSVYPELRDYCRSQGYELHIVDLHWKTGLEKQQDHEFPELCLGELARQMEVAYVIPVLFLSNSLGTPLLPKTIENQDFEMALKSADNKELLQKWYQLDGHAQPPCYRLQPIASHIPGFKENSPEERERALNEWRSEIERTLSVLVNVFPQELRDTYLTTVVEQEIHNTVFMSQELARRCLWLYRVCAPAASQSQEPSPGETELRRRLEALHKDLKNQLNEKHILRIPVRWVEGGLDLQLPDHAQYVTEVTSQLGKHLRGVVDTIIEEDQAKNMLKSSYGIDSRLFQELMQQTSFCQRAAQCSINREAVLQEIKSYVVGDSQHPLVVHGPRGCGKTTLLARAAQCCHTWQPEALLLVRFVSISAQSHTTEQLVRSIVDQCSILTYGHQSWAVHSIQNYTELLPRLLAASFIHRPQIIMIDGIDQVKDYGTEDLDWLPVKLPENVKFIFSVANDSHVFAEVQKKITDSAALLPMPVLGKLEAQSILMASVMQYNHSVSSRVQDCVRSSVQDCTLPLYVKVLAWQTSWWTDKDHDIVPKGNITNQLHLMLEELEVILGKERVEHALALVTASKTGLTDSEMLDLLAHDAAFHSEATYVLWAPGCLFWARLNKYLAPFLLWSSVDGPSTLHWRDEMLYNAVKQKYLGDQQRKQWAHQILVHYYQGKWADELSPGMIGRHLPQPDKTNKCYNRRKLDELPFQVFHLSGSIKEEFLYNHSWLFVKLCGSDVYHVLEDIALEQRSLAANKQQEKDLLFLKKCLEESACALAYDGRQFYSQMYGHLSAIFGSHEGKTSVLKKKPSSSGPNWESPEGYKFVKELYEVCCHPPVLSLLPLQPLVGGSSEAEGAKNVTDKLSVSAASGAVEVEDLDQLCRFDMVMRLAENPDYVVTVSTEREEISVWDVHDAVPLRTLVGVTHPINLKAIDETRCVVLCRRELRIYDLDTGEFVTRLKGVMNQKMPYYGLHDREHLVALSRNRMYVNLMNLESGDCVTTFKAGEDRFLNSLLVSGDGRVLVCGDETQKPFPLLVWNLASRKLLYDLRIPHHDFVTSLSAITHEGHYVCCVAKEVDEPSPNFIVVYDLQSGTLFKKWKPGVNTVSLDISSRDGCVISGLEDARILVWDLITGNCRWCLCGHTAPVNFLRLDSLGGSFLSADSVCRDRSLRLWDLNKGELLAVYTPERPVTSCEVTSGGHLVVLALRGRSHITTLKLRGPQVDDSVGSEKRCYGRPENVGKTFDLRDEAQAAER